MIRKLMLAQLIILLAVLFALYVYRIPIAQMQLLQQSKSQTLDSRNELNHMRSPYEIAEYINQYNDEADLDEIWKMLQIITDSNKPGRCGCRGYDCPGNCKSEVIEIGSNRDAAVYALLRICYAGDMICRFLLFKKELDWKYIGIADSLWGKYEPVQHRIISSDDYRWLILRAGTGGTGALEFGERWFEISDDGLKEVLSYPLSGHSVQGEAKDYEFKSSVVSRMDDGYYSVAIKYEVSGKPIHQPNLRWTTRKQERVYFRWDETKKEFFLDKERSRLAETKGDPIYDWLIQQSYLK